MRYFPFRQNHDTETEWHRPPNAEQVRTFMHELAHMPWVQIDHLRMAPMGSFEFLHNAQNVTQHVTPPGAKRL